MLNFVSLNGSVLPVKRVARTMRYTNTVIKFVPKKCKTTTYQKSFFIRTCQIWKNSASIINIETQTLNSFKTVMFNFYLASLLLPYNPNNPETFKSICLKCNTVRNFFPPLFLSYFLLYSGTSVIGYAVAVSLPFFVIFSVFFFFNLLILIVAVRQS